MSTERDIRAHDHVAVTWPVWTEEKSHGTRYRTVLPDRTVVVLYCARFRNGTQPRYKGDRRAYRFEWLARVPQYDGRGGTHLGPEGGREIARGKTSDEAKAAVALLVNAGGFQP